MYQEEYFKWFKEIKESEYNYYGYKVSRISDLLKKHYPIPRGFCISSQKYFEFINQTNLKEQINQILETIDYKNNKDIQEKAQKIQSLILKQKIDDEFLKQFSKKYIKVGETQVGWLNSKVEAFVSLRASLVSEKISQKHLDYIESLLGFLNIKSIKNVIYKIKELWSGIYSYESLKYISENKLDIKEIGTSVIVQRMINADKSGYMQTTNQVGEKNNIVIEAIYGFGGKTIIPELTPDHYEVEKKYLDIKVKQKNQQEFQLKRILGKNKKINIEKDADKQKIENYNIKDLAVISKRLEKDFKNPQNVDWAIEKSDIYLISCEPVDVNLKKVKKVKTQNKIDNVRDNILVKGIGTNKGIVKGKAKIIKTKKDLEEIDENSILISKKTDIENTQYLKKVKGIVIDLGSSICHASLIAKKYDKPCIVGTKKGTEKIKDGELIEIDGKKGYVYKINSLKPEKIEVKEEPIKTQKKEPEYPENITKTFVKLNDYRKINELNFSDIDSIVVTINSLFDNSEFESLNPNDFIFRLKNRLNELNKLVKNKIIYKIDLHPQSLVTRNTADYELEILSEINNQSEKKINILIDNLKSDNELIDIKKIYSENLGIVIKEINKLQYIDKLLNKKINFIVIDIDKEDPEIKKIIDLSRKYKILRIVDIKENFSDNYIKDLIEHKINAVFINNSQLKIKETIFRKERELLKNLLSI